MLVNYVWHSLRFAKSGWHTRSLQSCRTVATPSRPRCHLHPAPVPACKLRPFSMSRDLTNLRSYGPFLLLRLLTRFSYKHSSVLSLTMHTSIQCSKRTHPQTHFGIADPFFLSNYDYDNRIVPLQYFSLRSPAFLPCMSISAWHLLSFYPRTYFVLRRERPFTLWSGWHFPLSELSSSDSHHYLAETHFCLRVPHDIVQYARHLFTVLQYKEDISSLRLKCKMNIQALTLWFADDINVNNKAHQKIISYSSLYETWFEATFALDTRPSPPNRHLLHLLLHTKTALCEGGRKRFDVNDLSNF